MIAWIKNWFGEPEAESNLVSYARHELSLIGGSDDEMQQQMNAHIIKMVREFSGEGHSGFSASYAVSILEKLLRFQPLRPLTGQDDEWTEVWDGHFQNKRCSHVFKEADGAAYDSNGIVWRDREGCHFTSSDSRVPVTFPYTPKTVYRDARTRNFTRTPEQRKADHAKSVATKARMRAEKASNNG